MILKQRKNFKLNIFELKDSSIFVKSKSFGSYNEYEIPYENIQPNKYNIKSSNSILFFIAIFFFLLALLNYYFVIEGDKDIEPEASFVWIFFGVVLTFFGVKLNENYWKIYTTNNQYLKFFKKLPNEKKVNEFLDEFYKKRNSYLIETYGNINPNLDYEKQYNNIVWLKTVKAFSENDFNEKILELEEVFNKRVNKIGF